jgi:anti-sigma B factor antagonist
MDISKTIDQNVVILTLSGDLMGGPESVHFKKVIDESIANEQNQVVVDMGKVQWMNSSGLGMLISALTSLRSGGGDLRLVNLSDRLRRPLEITRLDTVFQQFNTASEAVISFK